MSLQCYHELFLGQVEVLEEVGITVPDESLVESIAMATVAQVLPKKPIRRLHANRLLQFVSFTGLMPCTKHT